ncbi:MAG TPA: hypothetical protein VHE30_26330 [Polyangiaceae bacterium]|nr:hypothetical protein [Polyangiaceae bacterium]
MRPRPGPSSPRPRRRLGAAIVTALLCAAPVPGDIGSCGQPVQALDAPRFFSAHKTVDCRRCDECAIATKTCDYQCSRNPPLVTAFPADCQPLVHDGEVCLRALLDASCDDYATYVADESPVVPTECDFCPEGK